MFVKWDCGCIGLKPVDDEIPIIIQAHDMGQDEYAIVGGDLSWSRCMMTGHHFVPVDADTEKEYDRKMMTQLNRGMAFRNIKRFLDY